MPTMQELISSPSRIKELMQPQPVTPDALYERTFGDGWQPTQRYYDLFSDGVETHPIVTARVRRG